MIEKPMKNKPIKHHIMKRFCTCLLLFTSILAWTGCSETDDAGGNKDNNGDTPTDTSLLLGKWETYKEYYGDSGTWNEKFGADQGYIATKEYRADGTCIFGHEEIENSYVSTSEYRYSVEDDLITVKPTDIPDEELTPDMLEYARIDQLTADELVLAYDYEDENGQMIADKEYLRRID